MAFDKAIIRAGTKTLVAKDSGRTIAARSHPMIYVNVIGAPNALVVHYNSIACMDSKTLLPLWVKERLSNRVESRTNASYYGLYQYRLWNDYLYYSTQGWMATLDAESSAAMCIFDLGMNFKYGYPSPEYTSGAYADAIKDMVGTDTGHVFVVTPDISVDGSAVNCLDSTGAVVATYQLEDIKVEAMTASLEQDGVFRLYLAGWSYDVLSEDYAMDMVQCVSYDPDTTTFTLEWTWTDPDTEDAGTLIEGNGRGYSLYTPEPLESTLETVYFISIVKNLDGYTADVNYARITVITEGVTVHQWMVQLNDAAGDVLYDASGGGDNLEFESTSATGKCPTIEGALIYRNCNHYFYFRGSSTKYPSSIFKICLTTGAAAQTLSCVTLSTAGVRPKLMGVSEFKSKPRHCESILIQTPTQLKLISPDDLTTEIAGVGIAEVMQSYRAGIADHSWYFRAPRMNRYLRLST